MGSLRKQPREYVQGRFAYGALVYDRVGIRLKGHRAMQGFDGKPAFKINLAKYDKDQQLVGLKRLTLNNMVEDATMMREVLGYRLLREAGVPAPRAGYAAVYVNDEYYGLYANIESVDKQFLKHRFASSKGPMFEGEYGCDLYPDDVPGFELDSGKEEDRGWLAAFADAPLASIDRKAVISYLAMSALLGDFDGYRHSHNYRIYRDETSGQWSFIPWGLDRVFKRRLSVYDSGGLVAKLCFADTECRADYAKRMHELADAFDSARLDLAMDQIAELIDQLLIYDPRKPDNLHKTRTDRAAMRGFITERAAEVRREVSCIVDGKEVDLDGDGYGCTDCNDGDAAIHPGAAELCGDKIDNDCSAIVDDAPACECPTVELEGARFALCNFPMTWDEAATFCEGRGATLARVDSAEQSRKLFRAAGKQLKKNKWWIGFTDRADEGTFGWRDGASVSYTGWGKNEPDNDACNQDCAALKDAGAGKWQDTHCASRLPFVCRLD